MKKFLMIVLSAATVSAYGQYHKGQPVSYSDPAVSNLQFTDVSNAAVNTDMLTIGTPVKIRFTVSNNDGLNAVPEGTCMLKITLGSKFRLVNDLGAGLNLPLSNYFNWTITEPARGAQFIITGDLYHELPPKFSGPVEFTLMPWREGSSTATCQVLISNHENPVTVLSDMAPMNNFVSKSYTNAKPFGVKFTRFDAAVHGCALELNWAVFDEDKLTRRFIIETSDDGISFQPVRTVTATGASSYTLLLDGMNKTSVTVRIKDESQSQFVYSGNVYAANLCSGKFEIGLYPNPVPSDINEISLLARAGIFNGKYNIRLTDAAGKEVMAREATYNNQLQVSFKTGFITVGAYYVTVTGEDGRSSAVKFVKQ